MFNFFDLLLNKMENIIKSFNHASHASSASDRVPPPAHASAHSYIHSAIHSFRQPFNCCPNCLRAMARFIGSFRVCGTHSCDLAGPLLWLLFSFFYIYIYMPRLPGAVTATPRTTVMRVTRAATTRRTTVEKQTQTRRKLTWLL